MGKRKMGWRVGVCVGWVALGMGVRGCEARGPGIDPVPLFASIELRGAQMPVAEADSEAVFVMEAILRDINGIAIPGFWVRFSDTPHFGWFEHDSLFADANGSAVCRYHFIMPRDTVNVTFQVSCGLVTKKISLGLHGS